MGIGIGAFIASGVGLLICLGGLLGLWRRRRRFDRRPVEEAVCPRCRYPAADPSRSCSECGADLPATGIIDARWPTRRDWIIRTFFIGLVVVPLPMILGASARGFSPGLHREVLVNVIGVAGDDEVPRESLMFIESRRWFATGTSVNGFAPPAVRPDVTYAIPPEDSTRRISVRGLPDQAIEIERDSLGDMPYPRRSRASLEGAAARCLDLADAIVTGGEPAVTAAAQRTDTGRSTSTATAMRAGPTKGARVELTRRTYESATPGTVVPLARYRWRTSRSLVPPPEAMTLAAVVLGGFLLVRGWWRSRHFRPVPARSTGA